MTSSIVGESLRAQSAQIVSNWRTVVITENAELARLNHCELTGYLADFLNQLAIITEDPSPQARSAFLELGDRHARQRLAAGISLEAVSVEHASLRRVVLEHLQCVALAPSAPAELIRLNEALDHATERAVHCYAERRDELGERFVKIIGHDLRNPLNAASIATDAMTRSETLSSRGQKRLSTIARANARMARMIENVLDFARAHLSGKLPLLVEDGDVGEVCQNVFEEALAANPGRVLDLAKDGDLRGAFDAERLRQAVDNLLSNALQHGLDPIRLTVAETSDHSSILTRVSSHGEPIPKPLIAKSFDLLAESSTPTGGGRLGLYVTSLIAKAHGGACEVTTSATGETVVTVCWPRSPTAPSN